MDGNLWHAVEAEGKADGTYAAVDVELHVADPKVAHDVLLAHGRKDEWADEGNANLTPMRMTGEHQVD